MAQQRRIGVVVAATAAAVLGVAAAVALAIYNSNPVDASAVPPGETWWCFASARGTGCARTGQECVTQLAMYATDRREVCRTQDAAFCFTTRIYAQDTHRLIGTQWQCHPTRDACMAVRRDTSSRCGPVD